MLIVQCPYCYSENVTNLSFDSNDFFCNDCGEKFEANNGAELEEDDEMEDRGVSFIDLPPELAKNIADQLKSKNTTNPRNSKIE